MRASVLPHQAAQQEVHNPPSVVADGLAGTEPPAQA
jgi:hypothetical protein